MRKNSERLYWMTNEKWYRANYDKDCFELTSEAPPRARKSFAMWQRPERLTFRYLLRLCRAYFV